MSATGVGCRFLTYLAVAGFGICMTSCATLQVPLSPPAFPPGEVLHSSLQGIDIGVSPIAGKDAYLQLFDEYLPGDGVAALWVEIHNTRPSAIELRPGNWYLRIGNQTFPALRVSEVFERYYRGNRIRMYSVRTDGTARLDMERVTFPPGSLPQSQKRGGFLFFRIDPAMGADWNREATLCMHDVRLDRRLKTNLEVALNHANP